MNAAAPDNPRVADSRPQPDLVAANQRSANAMGSASSVDVPFTASDPNDVVALARGQKQADQSAGGNGDGSHASGDWPARPAEFGQLLLPVEAAQYLRLDETGSHTPQSAIRTLNYWRDRGELKATKYARRIWFRRVELNRFLERKTEE